MLFGIIPSPFMVIAIGVAIFILLLPVILIRRRHRSQMVSVLSDASWLEASGTNTPLDAETFKALKEEAAKLGNQESFDYALVFAGQLKGALADPRPKRLERFAKQLTDKRLLSDRLWRDMARPMSEIHHKYDREIEQLVEMLGDNSKNAIQLHVVQKLATTGTVKSPRLKAFGQAFAGSQIWRTYYNFGRH